jgi:site-specific DNA-methyltransferase (adenine-specific)
MAASKPRKGGTRTSAFGVGKREGHDSSPFYERFHAPEVSTDDTIAAPIVLDRIIVGDARDMRDITRKRSAKGTSRPTTLTIC